MIWIHERTAWPDLSWRSDELAAPLAAVRHAQGRLLGRMEGLGFELRAEAGLAVLTGDAVKTSAIEGERLDPEAVRSSIARRLGLDAAGLPEPGRAVDGLVDVLLDAVRNFRDPLTRERLFEWHASLFPIAHPRMVVGGWRTDAEGPMQVVSGPIGARRVHYEAPAAHRIEKEVGVFLDWFNADSGIDPVLMAGAAHFWFVTIHPFDDGNGRIARAIADMCLARADGLPDRFYSMSTQIEAERKDYYRELELRQRGDTDITPWLEWFIACLGRSIVRAEGVLAGVLGKARLWAKLADRPVNPRQRLIINRMLDGFKGYMTTAKYAKIAKCSSDTALRDIRALVEYGVLVQNPAKGRSTSYRLADPPE
ncbi:MAG: Fic family protein [Phycisphaerales bacterium]|nr:MAG: Fic family protein [Phycisphaerales bacterium]